MIPARAGWAWAAALGVLAVACGRGPAAPCPAPGAVGAPHAAPLPTRAPLAAESPFDSAFALAAAEFRVPQPLLRAIGWVETRWQMVEGMEEFPGRPRAFGVMGLRGATIERGATLAAAALETTRTDPVANIRAAAALLDAYAREDGIDRSRDEQWDAVVARFSGIELPEGRAAYVREVNRALQGPTAAAPAPPCPPTDSAAGPDYPSATWRSSPNFNQRPPDSTGALHAVIIHTCEDDYAGCWSWLVNPISQVSAHYVMNEDGDEISQLVLERDRAWHIAALYDDSLNRRHESWLTGVQSNHFTVGIEHAGYARQASFPASQIDASARLVCDVTRDRGIPRDWQHIVAHGQLQPENRSDPGPNWPWTAYLHRVQAHCGEVVVDDSAQFNDPAAAVSAVPAAWPATDATPDYYGGGYRWASAAPDATDSATFSFRLDAAGPRTVDARWTSGSNRSPRAAYVVIDAAGNTLATVQVDQTAGGGRWHPLGTWPFPAGWNRVVLSRRDTTGFVVIADAVRIRE